VILIDSDVLLIELRYRNDARFAVNRQALQQAQADPVPLGITSQVLLEVVGNLSFGTSPQQIPLLPRYVCASYGLQVVPDVQQHPDYAGCTVGELLAQMGAQMALGDAVQALQIARHAPAAQCLLTWNARHFAGKLVIAVFSPEDWLNQRLSGTP
jgi:hypothetical protein